ncbi:hypothetical protein ACTXT7_007886 [Hymenolepis weldensis]
MLPPQNEMGKGRIVVAKGSLRRTINNERVMEVSLIESVVKTIAMELWPRGEMYIEMVAELVQVRVISDISN